ncbi:MAG: threonine synthase, partial [Spirochaetaceae bacterium]|nr:threonine synthase [Spirochaetaceae bacterium]
MDFVSTRNQNNKVSFAQAITNCLCADGGFYVPSTSEDMRPWIYYLKETTSFSYIAGSLTSAFMKNEFSPL